MRIGLKIKLAIIFIILAAAAFLLLPSQITPPASSQHFYKWQDAQGHWHYTDTAPKNINATTVTVQTDSNIIRSTPASNTGQDKKDRNSTSAALKTLPTALDPRQAAQALEKAQQAKQAMEQRQQQLDSALN